MTGINVGRFSLRSVQREDTAMSSILNFPTCHLWAECRMWMNGFSLDRNLAGQRIEGVSPSMLTPLFFFFFLMEFLQEIFRINYPFINHSFFLNSRFSKN